jgi:hypothetical protein
LHILVQKCTVPYLLRWLLLYDFANKVKYAQYPGTG